MKISASIITAAMLSLFNSIAIAHAALAKGAVSLGVVATEHQSSTTVGAVERKLAKKAKEKSSNPVCETIKEEEYVLSELSDFKFKLGYDLNGVYTRTSLHTVVRMVADNPDIAQDILKAIDQGVQGKGLIIFLQEKCGAAKAISAFGACVRPICANYKVCTDKHGLGLAYDHLNANDIECALMLFVMDIFSVTMDMTETNCNVLY